MNTPIAIRDLLANGLNNGLVGGIHNELFFASCNVLTQQLRNAGRGWPLVRGFYVVDSHIRQRAVDVLYLRRAKDTGDRRLES